MAQTHEESPFSHHTVKLLHRGKTYVMRVKLVSHELDHGSLGKQEWVDVAEARIER